MHFGFCIAISADAQKCDEVRGRRRSDGEYDESLLRWQYRFASLRSKRGTPHGGSAALPPRWLARGVSSDCHRVSNTPTNATTQVSNIMANADTWKCRQVRERSRITQRSGDGRFAAEKRHERPSHRGIAYGLCVVVDVVRRIGWQND
jgi:hypothetical protein